MPLTYRSSDGNGGEVRTVSLATHISLLASVSAIFMTVILWQGGRLYERNLLVSQIEFEKHTSRLWHDGAAEVITNLQRDTLANRECSVANRAGIAELRNNDLELSRRIDGFHVTYRGTESKPSP